MTIKCSTIRLKWFPNFSCCSFLTTQHDAGVFKVTNKLQITECTIARLWSQTFREEGKCADQWTTLRHQCLCEKIFLYFVESYGLRNLDNFANQKLFEFGLKGDLVRLCLKSSQSTLTWNFYLVCRVIRFGVKLERSFY